MAALRIATNQGRYSPPRCKLDFVWCAHLRRMALIAAGRCAPSETVRRSRSCRSEVQ
jgi:hypothetical protein